MTQPVSTSERLAQELEALNAPPRLIAAARRGFFDDVRSDSKTPKVDLVNTLNELGYTTLAQRVTNGEFNETSQEIRRWFRSKEGTQTMREIFPAISEARWQDVFGVTT
ncbi:MAG: hypothetical protein LC778_10305 [Acidobacteria bacterium]|nr:hypothetical protein [Acidobacteriota bacterium]